MSSQKLFSSIFKNTTTLCQYLWLGFSLSVILPDTSIFTLYKIQTFVGVFEEVNFLNPRSLDFFLINDWQSIWYENCIWFSTQIIKYLYHVYSIFHCRLFWINTSTIQLISCKTYKILLGYLRRLLHAVFAALKFKTDFALKAWE